MCNNEDLKWINMAPLIFWATMSLSVCRLVTPHISWATVWRQSCPLTLQKQHIFFPLSMFLVQLRLSLHTMPNRSRKKLEDLHDMLARVLKARKQSVAQFVKCFSSVIQDYNFQLYHLSLCATLISKKGLTRRLSLISCAPWWLSIA